MLVLTHAIYNESFTLEHQNNNKEMWWHGQYPKKIIVHSNYKIKHFVTTFFLLIVSIAEFKIHTKY